MAANRNPIARLGSQDARVELNRKFIENSRRKECYYPASNNDADYNIHERQFVMSKKSDSHIGDGNKVIGHAGGLGIEFLKHFQKGMLPEPLERALILQAWQSAGVSVTSYNATTGNDDGFVTTYSGTTTLPAHVNIRAGQRLVVDIPSPAELATMKTKLKSGMVPFIARPFNMEMPGHKLKHAVRAAIHHPKAWTGLVAEEEYHMWSLAAKYTMDHSLICGLNMVRMLIQFGLLSVTSEPQTKNEWRGAERLRDQFSDILHRMNVDQDKEPSDVTQTELTLKADALMITLFKNLFGRESPNPKASVKDAAAEMHKKDMDHLKRSILIANCQDAESNTVTVMCETKAMDGSKCPISALVGFVPPTYVDKELENPGYFILKQTKKSDSPIKLSEADSSCLFQLQNMQINSLTKATAAFVTMSNMEKDIGFAVNSSEAGGTFDVRMNVK